jgi:prolyl-tRNA synthetase
MMTHSRRRRAGLPPRLAPAHVVISAGAAQARDTKAKVLEYCNGLAAELRERDLPGRRIEVEVDNRDMRGGDKSWEWVKQGHPAAGRGRPAGHRGGQRVHGRAAIKPHKEKESRSSAPSSCRDA